MLKKLILALALLILVLVVVIATRPSDFRITRTATFTASPAAVWEHVNDLHHWEAWSPWAKLDPAAKTTYEGPGAGTGAVFKWAGNNEVGEGSMTITETRPGELVKFRLDFLKPFAGTNASEWSFKAEGPQTVVTWTMTGKNNFLGKAMNLVMDCDKMVGGQFEKGLANLKPIVETPPAK